MLLLCIPWLYYLYLRLVMTIFGGEQEHMPDPWVLAL